MANLHIFYRTAMEVVSGEEAERRGAEQRHLMPEWQVIKISLSGNWRLRRCTRTHTHTPCFPLTDTRWVVQVRDQEPHSSSLSYASSIHHLTSLHPVPLLQLADEWIHLLVSCNCRKKKSTAAAQSTSAGFRPELMKSHAYCNWSCCHGNDEPTTGICLCFKAKLSHQFLPWARKAACFSSVPRIVLDLRWRH